MDIATYKLLIKGLDLSSRTFGNNKKHGPILNFDMSAHCEVVTGEFYIDGWQPDKAPTAKVFYNIGWNDDVDREKLKDFLAYCEGQILAWEALNK